VGVAKALYVQLFNSAGTVDKAPSIAQSKGMTLAWGDEFTSPLSISRTGVGTVYTATKPSYWGPSEFGDAVFADPAWGTGNLGAVGRDFLRIRASGRPSSIPDPLGYNRSYLGGMVSSAALGGSGFSAQYGYFEARILGAPGAGTWPAFWTLSTGSIVTAGASTGEVDAIELYGHDTGGSCRGIHNWIDGRDDQQVDCRDGITDWALNWHTYGAKVTPDGTTFYIDGQQVKTMTGLINADQPHYFLINLAMGAGWPTDLTPTKDVADLYVDYIRVYS
jgi:hypothetical protein